MTMTTTKARPLSHDEALKFLEPACQCQVEVVVTPTGPTDATQWVARVRLKEHGGTQPWVDAATSEPRVTSGEARGESVLAFLAKAACDARVETASDEDVALSSAKAALGDNLTAAQREALPRALAAFKAAYDGCAGPGHDLCEAAGWRAFVLTLLPDLAAVAPALGQATCRRREVPDGESVADPG